LVTILNSTQFCLDSWVHCNDPDRYQHVELQWNDSELLKNGIVLVDTIGTEDIDDRYIQQTHAEMEKGSAIVFLFNMKMAGTQTEQTFLENFLGDTGKKLFIVLNRSDVLDSDEDRKMVLEDFKQRFKPFFSSRNIRVDDRIFMVSAKTGQGLKEFRQRLVDFIANERVRELLIQHVSLLKNALSAIDAQINTHLRDMQNKLAGDEKTLWESQKKIELLENDMNSRKKEIEDMKGELIEQAESHIEDEIENIRQRTLGSIKNVDRDEAQGMITDVLDRLTSASDRVGKKLQKEICNSLDSRLRRWTSRLDLEDIESRFAGIGINSGMIDMTKVGVVGGGTSVCWGAVQAFSAYTTGVTTVSANGALWQFSTFLFGGGGGPWLAAAPWIAGGVLIASISYVIYNRLKEKNKLEFQEELRNTFREIFKKLKTEMSSQINIYVNDQVDNYLSNLKNEITRQKKQIEFVISEIDVQVLQRMINDSKGQLNQLNSYQNKLSKIIPA